MSLVSDLIRRKAESEIRSKGLLVWLDKEGTYSSLVDRWRLTAPLGEFSFPVLAFRGSFLELLAEGRQTLSGRFPPKCLIHMPGFNEQSIKETPLYEAYKAGQRWRLALESLVEEAAAGRLPPAQIKSLIESPDFSLETAEAALDKLEEVPQELKTLLNRYGENRLILKFLAEPRKIMAEGGLGVQGGVAVLRNWLNKTLGMDESWFEDWNTPPEERDFPEVVASVAAAYLLCLEFVGDLTQGPPTPRLERLAQKGKAYRTKAGEILKELRETKPEEYKTLAKDVEANLLPAETSLQAAALGKLDTFLFEADVFLSEALDLLRSEAWEKALSLATARLPGRKGLEVSQTFWLSSDIQRLWLWEWVASAARLGVSLVKAQTETKKMANLEAAAGEYVHGGWETDRQHREFAVFSQRYAGGTNPLYFDRFTEVRLKLASLYRKSIDRQSQAWNTLCETTGFLGPSTTRQRHFFNRKVRPLLEMHPKVAVILVDALRYELGRDLEEILSEGGFGKIQSDWLLAELPTITSVGMNALMPAAQDEEMTPLLDDQESTIQGFRTGERQIRDPGSRCLALKDKTGTAVEWCSLEEFLALQGKDLNRFCQCSLSVVSTQDIDQLGEAGALGLGINYFSESLARLKTAVTKLKAAGFGAVVIASDHGFLLGDETLENNRAPKLPKPDRRYALDTLRTGENLTSVTFAQLQYRSEKEGRAVVFERSSHLLSSRPAGSFYHGGNSPQERIIPVLTLVMGKPTSLGKNSYTLKVERLSPVMGCQVARLVLEQSGNRELFAPETLELRVAAQPGFTLKLKDASDAKMTGDLLTLTLETPSQIFFTLEGPEAKGRLLFQSLDLQTQLTGGEPEEYFGADLKVGALQGEPAQFTFPAEIPQEYHPALLHLKRHGSLTEQYLVNTLGGKDNFGPRKARRFADKITEWNRLLPFTVIVDVTVEGKTYGIEKG